MALLGKGAITTWNDVRPDGREVFYGWHEEEHIAERVGIPGFLRGRRYRRIEAEIEWFTLYETTTSDVLTSAAYQERLNNPTERTRYSAPFSINMTRGLTTVVASRGDPDGGCLLAVGLTVDDAAVAATRAALGQALVDELGAITGICAAHLTESDRAASRVQTAEKKLRDRPSLVPDAVLLVESSRVAPLAAARRAIEARLAGLDGVAQLRPFGTYGLEFQLLRRPLP